MLGGKAGVLTHLWYQKSGSPKLARIHGDVMFQNLEQMAEGKAILAVVHSSNAGHASTASEKSVFK